MATELGLGLAKRGHQVHFITYSRPVRLGSFHENVFYHEVDPADYPLFEFPPYESSLASELVDVVKFEQLDLLHVHYAIPHASVAYMAKKILLQSGIYIPVITTLHGTDITLVGHDKTFAPVVEFSINKSDGVTAVSNYLKDVTYEHFNITKDIRVIYNFVDFNRFKKTNKGHFKKAIAPNGEKIITHVSNFRKVKRVEDIVYAFKKVLEKVPAKLLLIGDGPERTNLERLCRQQGTCQDVRFLGKQEAIEELLAISDVFMLPSGSESFGLAALEAMACEVPVISSDIGGLPELNVDGKTGFICKVGDIDDYADKAIKLLTNEALLDEFRVNALNHAKKYDLEILLPQYESYYTEILEGSRLEKLA